MKVSWIEYKGKRILFSDYSGCTVEQMISQLKTETNMILQENGNVLYLADFTNTVISPDYMKAVNEAGKKTKSIVNKSALVGISGMKAMLMNTFNMITGLKARAFSDLILAKEYLIN